jgi:predicted CoA-substrate-specific enzyme activase
MNGSCAGGTGAFIDQMAALLNVKIDDFNDLAGESTNIYPIASRCGVFAKTDVQNLIARKIPIADIAASIFHAVAVQTINALARGFDLTPKILLCGGPLTFLSNLRKAFYNLTKMTDRDYILPENSALLPALGAATANHKDAEPLKISEFAGKLRNSVSFTNEEKVDHLPPLFKNEKDYKKKKAERRIVEIPHESLNEDKKYFLGIDSGSTTSKIVLINEDKEIVYKYYSHNKGNPLKTIQEGLDKIREEVTGKNIEIKYTAVTGYGEDLLQAAYGLDVGMVETIAHFQAAREIDPDVSFILDIGGQDMKAAFIRDGIISNIEINEACSSGCGSFIEQFANSMEYSAQEFGMEACSSKKPCDLGTRCTVFMNSRVKQSLRDGAEVGDISAGLAYSVVKNCLFKVLKIKDINELGNHIVVQGGTFKNEAVFRAMELLTESTVSSSDVPELMGAYGAALNALTHYTNGNVQTQFRGLDSPLTDANLKSKNLVCKACTNHCIVTRFDFDNGKHHYSGNKCEKVFSSKGQEQTKGYNFVEFKRQLLFDRHVNLPEPKMKLGIPRMLGIFANYPFWHTLFTQCDIDVVLSDISTNEIYEKGLGSVMSDNICFPAKLAHGHIANLAEKGVDRIFYPFVTYEENIIKDAANSFNCPIVSAYSEVISSAIDPNSRYDIPFDAPSINFHDDKLLENACRKYLTALGVDENIIPRAIEAAKREIDSYKKQLSEKAYEIYEIAKLEDRPVVLLAMRPYHIDELVHQKASDIISELGCDVITEDISGYDGKEGIQKAITVSQWSYPNRIFKSANFAAQSEYDKLFFVQLNSFGCGPDGFIIDEMQDILRRAGKTHTLIKIDEITSTGSLRLRLRSMVESAKLRKSSSKTLKEFENTAPFLKADRDKTILIPFLSEYYSYSAEAVFGMLGYNFETLPKPDKASSEAGLKYANNEVCYPATIVIGDIIKALQSGKYDLDKIAIGMSQTGGQCRATNYIALIKKAMISAGFKDIPVISLAIGDAVINHQPGFDFKIRKVIKMAISGMLFGDVLAKMYYSAAPREVVKGSAALLKDKYLQKAKEIIPNNKFNDLMYLLSEAVRDFNKLVYFNEEIPRVGVVGEIYVKYNPYAHYYVVDKLIEAGIEPVVPPMQDFIFQYFVNSSVAAENHIQHRNRKSEFFKPKIEWLVNKFVGYFDDIYKEFRYYRESHDIHREAEGASELISLYNHYGEGWLIAGEIAGFAKSGVNSVVSFQPFGCIANHIISKGIESKIKKRYPQMNLLYLDFDSGTSEVNIDNRLHFIIQHAKETVEHKKQAVAKTVQK